MAILSRRQLWTGEDFGHNGQMSGVDLYWLPLGAGGSYVRLNGRIFEMVEAVIDRRRTLDIYHAALEVHLPEGEFVIEIAPVPDSDGSRRGVVASAPVGSSLAGRFRIFRYELRCWEDGSIPDIDEAVDSPAPVTAEEETARRLVGLLPSVPMAVWGRDELDAGEMWTSNSVISWLIVRAGLAIDDFPPPAGGRAPGWDAGIVVAGRATEAETAGGPRDRR